MSDTPPPASTGVPRVGWRRFVDVRLTWRQGEHVVGIGPTGVGKTNTMLELLRHRERRGGAVCVLASKPRDDTMESLTGRGYRRYSGYRTTGPLAMFGRGPRVPEGLQQVPTNVDRVLMWPPYRDLDRDPRLQADVFRKVLQQTFRDGSWCVFLDELPYLTDELNLSAELDRLYNQGRSMGVTLVGGAQRPRFIPRSSLANTTHLLIYRTGDEDDLRRVSGLSAADSDRIRATAGELRRIRGGGVATEVLYVNTRSGDMVITTPPKPPS